MRKLEPVVLVTVTFTTTADTLSTAGHRADARREHVVDLADSVAHEAAGAVASVEDARVGVDRDVLTRRPDRLGGHVAARATA